MQQTITITSNQTQRCKLFDTPPLTITNQTRLQLIKPSRNRNPWAARSSHRRLQRRPRGQVQEMEVWAGARSDSEPGPRIEFLGRKEMTWTKIEGELGWIFIGRSKIDYRKIHKKKNYLNLMMYRYKIKYVKGIFKKKKNQI